MFFFFFFFLILTHCLFVEKMERKEDCVFALFFHVSCSSLKEKENENWSLHSKVVELSSVFFFFFLLQFSRLF